MTENVAEYCKSCVLCQATKSSKHKPFGELHPIPSPKQCFETVSMDFVTALSLTVRDHDAILTVTCMISKMTHMLPLRFANSSAAVIARLYLDGVCRLHGMTAKFVSDRDTRFASKF